MIPNEHGVPKKQWAKWDEKARETFNLLYGTMIKSPDIFTHPDARQNLNPEHWQVTAWNVSWLAADAVRDALREAA